MPQNDESNQVLAFIPSMIRSNRKRQGFSMEALAQRAGVSRSIVVRLERQHVAPRWATLVKLFTALDIPVWQAIAYEYMDESIPEIVQSVRERFESGEWVRQPGEVEEDGGYLEKLADFVLRELNKSFSGRLEEVKDHMDHQEAIAKGSGISWSKEQLADLYRGMTSRVRPEQMEDVYTMLDAAKKIGIGTISQ